MREDFANKAVYNDFFAAEDPQVAKSLSGAGGRSNLDMLAQALDVKVNRAGKKFTVSGLQENAIKALNVLKALAGHARGNAEITPDLIRETIAKQSNKNVAPVAAVVEGVEPKVYGEEFAIQTPNILVTARNDRQIEHIKNFRANPISFATGSAGTGKTYLSIALAVSAFKAGEFEKILIARPAVATEQLGFLPGDAKQKVDPYMRPIYDALHEMLGEQGTKQLMKDGKIEIAPIAYMRGRNIKNTVMVIDEVQNTTVEQMKMILTRLDTGTKVVLTGAENQIDLDKAIVSGLVKVMELLSTEQGRAAAPSVAMMRYLTEDIVRLPVVKQIEDLFALDTGSPEAAPEPQAESASPAQQPVSQARKPGPAPA